MSQRICTKCGQLIESTERSIVLLEGYDHVVCWKEWATKDEGYQRQFAEYKMLGKKADYWMLDPKDLDNLYIG
jgi:hypothetical protein